MIPLPAPNNSTSSSSDLGVKTPDGGRTSIVSPTAMLSHTQFEPYPSAVRLIVTFGRSSVNGELARSE